MGDDQNATQRQPTNSKRVLRDPIVSKCPGCLSIEQPASCLEPAAFARITECQSASKIAGFAVPSSPVCTRQYGRGRAPGFRVGSRVAATTGIHYLCGAGAPRLHPAKGIEPSCAALWRIRDSEDAVRWRAAVTSGDTMRTSAATPAARPRRDFSCKPRVPSDVWTVGR